MTNEITDAQIDALKERIEYEKSLPEDDKEAFFTWFRLHYGGDVNTDFYTAWKAGKADSDKRRKAEAKPELPADERERFEEFTEEYGFSIPNKVLAFAGWKAAKADAAEQNANHADWFKDWFEAFQRVENYMLGHALWNEADLDDADPAKTLINGIERLRIAEEHTRAQVERAVRLAVAYCSRAVANRATAADIFVREACDVIDMSFDDILRELAEQPTTEQSSGVDGWIEWHGGECPVADGVSVEIKFYDGSFFATDMPEHIAWAENSEEKIIAYRIVQPAPVAQQEPTDWKIVARDGNPPEGLYVAIYDGGGVMPVALIAYGKYKYAVDENAAEDDEYISGFGWHDETEESNGDGYTYIRNVIAYLPTNYDSESLKRVRALLSTQQPQASVSAQSDKEAT